MVGNIGFINTDPLEFKKIFTVKINEMKEIINSNDQRFFDSNNKEEVIRILYEDRAHALNQKLEGWQKLYEIAVTLSYPQRKNKLVEWELKLERVREIDIHEVLNLLGIETQRRFINCPYHNDKTPSCYINPSKNFLYSFCCQKTTDGIQLYKINKGCEFKEAVNDLYKQFYI